MADVLEIIKTRRNIKQFLPKFVSWDEVSKVLDAGRHAPSSGNIQNWKFIVCYDQDQKQAIAELTYDQLELMQAAYLIVVCGEPDKAERYYGIRGERLYSIQNCAAAIQNMLLEGHSLGLGTAWVGAFDEEGLKSLLKIPDDVRPQGIIALGHAKEIPPKPPKYPLETVVYFGKWKSRLRDPDKYMGNYAAILSRRAQAARKNLGDAADFVVDKAKKLVETKKPAEHP